MTDSAADDLELFREYARTQDRRVRDRLIEDHAWIAQRCARRFADRGEPVDDLIQVGMLGLLKAVERFDPEFGTSFAGFAMPTVIGELKRHFRDATWSVRVPRRTKDLHVRLPGVIERLSHELDRAPTPKELAADIGVSEEELLEAIDAGAAYRSASLDELTGAGWWPSADDDAAIEVTDDRDVLRALLRRLPPREQKIILLRFYEEMSQQEIADLVGTSQVHVSRLIRSSLTLMRGEADVADLSA